MVEFKYGTVYPEDKYIKLNTPLTDEVYNELIKLWSTTNLIQYPFPLEAIPVHYKIELINGYTI